MESTITSKIATNSSELINTPQYLTAGYWFGTPDSLDFNKLALLASLSTLLIIFVFVVLAIKILNSQLKPPKQKFLSKIIAWTSVFGPVGWLLVVFRNQGIAFLSDRFWWLVWFISLVLVAFYLYRYNRQELPLAVARYETYTAKKKYFPKKKKKRK